MNYLSDRRLLFFLIVIAAILIPAAGICADTIIPPQYIGNTNNPYILPDGPGPGFLLSAAIGLVAGMLSATIGAGGGLIVVPALMSAGISGIYAVGSEIFRLFLFSAIEAVRMGLNKRINYKMALIMTGGTAAGGFAGFSLSSSIFLADPAGADVFISAMIIFWLIIYSFIIIPDFKEASHKYALELLRKENAEKEKEAAIQTGSSQNAEEAPPQKGNADTPQTGKTSAKDSALISFPDEEPWEIARTIRTMKLPPYINFPTTVKDKVLGADEELADTNPDDMEEAAKIADLSEAQPYARIPVLPALLLATVGGFFMALTGSAGIVLSFTVLTKGFGCVAAIVAGTDLVRLALSSGALTMGAFGLNGFINIYCITGLIAGTMTGIHLGGKAIRYIEPYRLKGLVSLVVISVIINRLLALPGQLKKAGADISYGLSTTLDQSALYIMIIGMVIFCGWLFYALVRDIIRDTKPILDEETK